ncbi:hypothetical protein A2Z54_01100 [Candidatus Curtissbacteria bacterium RIFCSPHIGHO2_02_39_8]|nr:MAG: hypothetical protein A2Z54_01100 [Candidatus Curtissbacteria bacterium RIFCSPHIGHO2_02_39_8]
MIKLVAFDYNGTLIADTWPILEGVNKVLKAFGKKPVSHKEFLEHFDVPVSIAYKNHGLDPDSIEDGHQKISQIFHPFYEDRVAKIRTRANARKVLEYLKEKGVKSIVFSNHTQYGVSKQLRRLSLEPYLAAVIANPERHTALVQRSKEEKLKDYLSVKKLHPDEILIVGDTIEEVQIARNLGAIVCSITHGNCSTARLKAAKPDYLIGNLKELIPIVAKLNKN